MATVCSHDPQADTTAHVAVEGDVPAVRRPSGIRGRPAVGDVGELGQPGAVRVDRVDLPGHEVPERDPPVASGGCRVRGTGLGKHEPGRHGEGEQRAQQP
jgi:hypothetical protein